MQFLWKNVNLRGAVWRVAENWDCVLTRVLVDDGILAIKSQVSLFYLFFYCIMKNQEQTILWEWAKIIWSDWSIFKVNIFYSICYSLMGSIPCFSFSHFVLLSWNNFSSCTVLERNIFFMWLNAMCLVFLKSRFVFF